MAFGVLAQVRRKSLERDESPLLCLGQAGLDFVPIESVHAIRQASMKGHLCHAWRGGFIQIQDLQFGVEIETVGRPREALARAVQSVVGGNLEAGAASASPGTWKVTEPFRGIWKVVSDGSLNLVPQDLQGEVVTPVLGYEDIPRLQEVIRALRAAGARVDRTCGIHCHVSADAFDGRTLANLAKLVFKQEPLILAALGVQQARLDRYTKPIPPEFIQRVEKARPRTREELNRLWYGYLNSAPQHHHPTRYHAVNLHSVFYRNTVEYRLYEGTLHAGKVKAYVQFALSLTAKALNSRTASSRKRTFDPTSARYDFRIFLLRLGMIGDEFRTARQHLLAAMPGDAAFKRGRPKGPKAGADDTGSAARDRPDPPFDDALPASEPPVITLPELSESEVTPCSE